MTALPEFYDRFRARVVEVQDDGTKCSEFVAAGLYVADKLRPDNINNIESTDFLWIKCKARTKWAQLRRALFTATYYQQHPQTLPQRNARFLANGRAYEDTATVAQMSTYGDGIIVFHLDEPHLSQPPSAPPTPNVTTANPPSELSTDPTIRRSPLTQPTPLPTPPLAERDAVAGSHGQHVTPTRLPPRTAIQHDRHSQQGAEYPHPIRPSPYSSATSTPPSEAIAAQAQARARERSVSSRGTPSAKGMSPSQHAARAATEQTRLAEINRKARAPATIQPESTTPRVNPVPFAEAPPRSPSPVPDRPVNQFFEPTDSQHEEADAAVAFQGKNLIQRVVNSDSLKLLEDAVQIGGHILESMEHQLEGSGSKDATHWLSQIAKLKRQMTRNRTVVGVVGNTGAGKSSVINALLDEERVVPTSCMRACTAVVTEISWNESDKSSERYRAEIEFITKESWEKELGQLVSDMTDSSGQVLKDATTTSESDAGVAFSKLKAVYPQTTKEDLADMSPTKFANHGPVRKVLGTTKHIRDSSAASFYKQLQVYVDSVEDKKKEKDSFKNKEKRRMEYWPLIKVVRIYTRADALSTGAVLVDLPGVQDSNAARGAVAESYMKQCSGLWVVAPINRAVNDKAAKDLMGDQFKRQMKFDGMVSNLTFVCSKIDDISITEAAGSLGLEDQIQEAAEEKDRLERDKDSLAKEVQFRQEKYESLQDSQTDLDEKIEVWEGLKNDLEEGKQVLAPHEKQNKKKSRATTKRKRKSAPFKPRKRVSGGGDSDDDDFVVDDDDEITESESESSQDSESDEEGDSEEPGEPLTAEQVQTKIDELKAAKKQAREDVKTIRTEMTELRKQIREIKEECNVLKSEMSAVCIAGRNEYSKGRIQEDYASGIRELDQEAAEQEDEDAFDPEAQLRDYEELARSLPVFCVSSRAYQKLSGRLKKDTPTPGFTSVEETGMVQLKAHCKKLTETGRLNHCKVFLNQLSSLLLSLNLWGSNDGTGKNMSKKEKDRERGVIKKLLDNLEDAMDKTTKLCMKRVKEDLVENIRQQYDLAHSEAQKVATPTAQGWGGHRDNGGLYWGTYKAICRRDGGPFRDYDFNKALTEPLQKVLASGWEKCFQRYVPRDTKALANDMKKTMETAHHVIVKRATERQGLGIVAADILGQKLETWSQLFVDLAGKLNASIMERQRDANRELAPVIALAMQRAYTLCTEESGTGSYKRMKAHMTSHVSSVAGKMYQDALDTVWAHLEAMLKQASNELESEKDAIYESMYQDYMNVLCGTQIDGMMPKWERTMRGAVADEVAQTDKLFQRLLVGESCDIILGRDVGTEADEKAEGDEEGGEAEAEAEAEEDKPTEVPVKAESPHDSATADAPMADNEDDNSGDFKPELSNPAEVNDVSDDDVSDDNASDDDASDDDEMDVDE
ncbi:hypothetical protein FKW77_004922 [Venturia effusa]|uniref:Nuclear GTPase SLIP-GC n=1 Tax=Venturia effusa TaxID=50376 RepID=A0A517LDT6_9PEZI|nr:hypothetical protein FKW77_004922 [Venturia effusa]